MSVEWTTWAWKQDLRDPTGKLVLLALADHAGHDGECWPGTARLAEMAGVSDRTVRRWLDEFEASGLLTRCRRRRRDGSLGTYTYTLTDQRSSVSTGHGCPQDMGDHHQRTPVSGRPADMGVRSIEPSVSEPSEEPLVVSDASGAEVLAHHLADTLAAAGAKRPNVTGRWVQDMGRLLKVDGRDPLEVRRVIDWLARRSDPVAQFWAPNVRSPEALRKHWDQMADQYRSRRHPARGGTLAAVADYLTGA